MRAGSNHEQFVFTCAAGRGRFAVLAQPHPLPPVPVASAKGSGPKVCQRVTAVPATARASLSSEGFGPRVGEKVAAAASRKGGSAATLAAFLEVSRGTKCGYGVTAAEPPNDRLDSTRAPPHRRTPGPGTMQALAAIRINRY